MSYPLMSAKETIKQVRSLKIKVLIDEIVNDRVPLTKGEDVSTPPQL